MSVHYEDDQITLHHGDALEVGRGLESGSVRTIVTSPPYFGLRDYGEDGQIGAEASLGEYVERMVLLFRELRRVLADDGTLWLNLGDSYSGGNRGAYDNQSGINRNTRAMSTSRPVTGFAGKNLLGVPWRVAFALQDDGWILRSDIIWAKPNPMPESVTDRPTKAHEYLFLFAKQPKYYYDADAIREESAGEFLSSGARNARFGRPGGLLPHEADGRSSLLPSRRIDRLDRTSDKTNSFSAPLPEHRNKRSVWEVATQPFPGSHFAVYPPELIRPCIRAGSAVGDTVLDPFSGSGTTGQVATFEGRKYVGIDLNAEYLDLSLRTRFAQPVLNLGAL